MGSPPVAEGLLTWPSEPTALGDGRRRGYAAASFAACATTVPAPRHRVFSEDHPGSVAMTCPFERLGQLGPHSIGRAVAPRSMSLSVGLQSPAPETFAAIISGAGRLCARRCKAASTDSQLVSSLSLRSTHSSRAPYARSTISNASDHLNIPTHLHHPGFSGTYYF